MTTATQQAVKIGTLARIACAKLQKDTPDDEVILDRRGIYALGGFPDEPTTSIQAHSAWKLHEVQYVEKLRILVMLSIGRWLVTVRGEGFRLLSAADSIEYGLDEGLASALSRLERGMFITKHSAATTVQERADQTDALMRLGSVKGAFEAVGRAKVQKRAKETRDQEHPRAYAPRGPYDRD